VRERENKKRITIIRQIGAQPTHPGSSHFSLALIFVRQEQKERQTTQKIIET
jgi:hypothetical protein